MSFKVVPDYDRPFIIHSETPEDDALADCPTMEAAKAALRLLCMPRGKRPEIHAPGVMRIGVALVRASQ